MSTLCISESTHRTALVSPTFSEQLTVESCEYVSDIQQIPHFHPH